MVLGTNVLFGFLSANGTSSYVKDTITVLFSQSAHFVHLWYSYYTCSIACSILNIVLLFPNFFLG